MLVLDSLSESACAALAGELAALSELRASSVCFLNAYASSPESGPARASLFTGLDMSAHGVWTDGVALPDRERTLPERFAKSGYRTWLVGRRQLARLSNWTTEHARPNEYAHLEWAHGPLHRSRQNAYLTWLQEAAPATYAGIFPTQADPDDTDIPRWQREAMAAVPDDLSFNRWVGARVCEQLSHPCAGQGFLGVAGFVVGESLGAAPARGGCGERLDMRALQQVDAALSEILERLRSEGLDECTTVVVTSARGCVPDPDAAQPLCERAIKVPLMVRAAGGVASAMEAAVSTMDLAPTLFEHAQITLPQRLQGMSLLAATTGIAPRGWALSRLRSLDVSWQTALRADQWKLVMSHGREGAGDQPSYCLYDLQADPGEANDLAGVAACQNELENMIDLMIDARVALEDRTEPRIASF